MVLVVALCFLAGVVGWWLNEPDDESFGAVDVGFLSDMETQHNGAIALGFAYLDREHDPLVGHFAREIAVSTAPGTGRRWPTTWPWSGWDIRCAAPTCPAYPPTRRRPRSLTRPGPRLTTGSRT